jgi:hypothetical protein
VVGKAQMPNTPAAAGSLIGLILTSGHAVRA